MARRIIKSYGTPKLKTIVISNIDESYFSEDGKAARILVQPIGMRTKYLIAAHPRSGTRWIASLLQSHGLDIPHETVGRDGIVSWQHIVPGKYKVKAKKVIHIVRNPIKTISSMAYVMDAHAFPFMFKYIGYPNVVVGHPGEERLAVSMYTWYYWNKLIEERADSRLKFEDILENPFILFNELNFQPNVLRINNNRENAISHPDFSWKNLKKRDKGLYFKILELFTEYGY